MTRHHSRVLESFDGTAITYHVAGEPHLGTIALPNGLGGNILAWEPVIQAFADRYQLISWDYRGLYGSEKPADPGRMAIQDHVEDLQAILAHEGVASSILIGWSMGVQVALEAYRQRRDSVRALVLLNGTYGRPLRDQMHVIRVADAFMRAAEPIVRRARVAEVLQQGSLLNPFLIGWMRRMRLVGKTVDESAFRRITASLARQDPTVILSLQQQMEAHDLGGLLPSVDRPTLVMAGERDWLCPPRVSRRILREIPDAELLVIPDATHYCTLEQPEIVNLRIEKFLRERGLS
jgi:pimeloyl-ACP methyl ester carboxylesterase